MCKHFSPENWFVLQIQHGKEHKLKTSIDCITEGTVSTYLPQKKMYHITKGMPHIVAKPLFPGYLFVQKDIEKILLLSRTRRIPEKIRPVIFHDSPAMIEEREMENIFLIAGENGLVELSEVVWETGQNIKIINGPLKDIKGKIIFIDIRKRKAKIMVYLINRMVSITLGFEMLEKTL